MKDASAWHGKSGTGRGAGWPTTPSGVKVKDPGTPCSHCPATDTISFLPRPLPSWTGHGPAGQPASLPAGGGGRGSLVLPGSGGPALGQVRLTQVWPQNQGVLGTCRRPQAGTAPSVSPWQEGGDHHDELRLGAGSPHCTAALTRGDSGKASASASASGASWPH